MKGQFFLISAIIILLGLFMIRTFFSVYDTSRREIDYSSDISDLSVLQIKDEYRHIIDFQPTNESVLLNVWNFSSFLSEKIEGFYHFSFIIFSNEDNLSIIVVNFLPGDVLNLSMSIDDFYYNFTNIPEGGKGIFNLYDTNITYGNMTISYSVDGAWELERFNVNFTGRKIHSFFDIYVEKNNNFLRTKDFYIRETNN